MRHAADQGQGRNLIRSSGGDVLRHQSAEGESDEVDALGADLLEEVDDIGSQVGQRGAGRCRGGGAVAAEIHRRHPIRLSELGQAAVPHGVVEPDAVQEHDVGSGAGDGVVQEHLSGRSLLGGERREPCLRATLPGGGQSHDDLVGVRGIGHPHLDALVV